MNVDYYSVLAKAVAGKDEAARDQIYRDAYGLIRKSSHLTRDDALSHAAALEEAIRQIERKLATEEARSAADIDEVLSRVETGSRWSSAAPRWSPSSSRVPCFTDMSRPKALASQASA